jgi:hypothetical protein
VFSDVPPTHPFVTEITWLAQEGIGGGYPDGTFRGTSPVSRQTLAALLYRLHHPTTPEPPDCTTAPFPDVPLDHPFCGEIAWLTDTGIAGGFPDDTFRPQVTVSRQTAAALLHRFVQVARVDAPPACTSAPYPDVAIDHPFCAEIAWLTENEIAGGYPDGTFRPQAPVARQTTAAMLHRLVGEGLVADPSPPPPEWFEGPVADFYVVPDPLPLARPGTLIRLQEQSQSGGRTTLRMMYHSRDAAGADRAVTGTISYPDAAPPAGGWPVVSVGNGTVGLAPQCAPSRTWGAVPTYGVTGVGVRTDYIGLGPVGELHPYLSRPSEGHSVIDAVRAARNLPSAGASDRWVALGHSQGGHAVLSASELAATYAPELDLLGTAALAPGSMFGMTYGGLDLFVTRIISVMMLYGGATEHPEIVPADYLGSTIEAAAAVLHTGCIDDIIGTLAPLVPSETFFDADPMLTEPARSLMLANDVGHVAAPSPVLVVAGTADLTVAIQRVRDLLTRMCGAGQVTQYQELPGVDHGGVYPAWSAQIDAWLADRIAGLPPTDSCPSSP